MLPNNREPTHPCDVLREEFGLLVVGYPPITPYTAQQWADICGTTPEYWLTLQKNYDDYLTNK
jgi:plasmid maintenance system antidote protein VapI